MKDLIDIETIFCEIDDFCKNFEQQIKIKILRSGKNLRNRSFLMSPSEIMTISILYHQSGYKNFKNYYLSHIMKHLKSHFKNVVSYNRFIELRKKALIPLFIFLITNKLGKSTGIGFIDSFKLEACHVKRMYSHKTLKKYASKGKTSTGWFFGTKLHIVINHKGEIISFFVSSGNVADNNKNVLSSVTKNVFGKLFGDKGYLVNKDTFKTLYQKGLQLITKIRSNMKNKLMHLQDKIILKKRGLIESVGNILKESLSLEHSRHRSVWGYFLNIITTLIAYQLKPNKPSIKGLFTQNP